MKLLPSNACADRSGQAVPYAASCRDGRSALTAPAHRRGRPRRQRMAAAATAVAMLLGSAGCASPYQFSPHLDKRLGVPAPHADEKTALAGNLHLSLEALMDQRRMLWAAAGETETMKNATAFGLIGVGAVGLYKGIQGEQSRTWLTKAGLLSAATYAGATWLEPNARQKIYLQGAVSLTCLALVTAPYEMPAAEYNKIRDDMNKSRAALEALATELRLVGRYKRNTDTWWLMRGGWNKLRWAGRVLDSADAALGNIERAGPLLRDMTAMLASDVATQVNLVSRDLSQVPAALALLKPNANLLIGSEVFPPPKKEEVDEDPPADDKGTPDKSSTRTADPQCGPGAPPAATTPADGTAQAAAAAASAASAAASAASSAQSAAKSATAAASSASVATAAAKSAKAAASAAQAALAKAKNPNGGAPVALVATPDTAADDAERRAEAEQARGLKQRLIGIIDRLDKSLGPVTSFVQRVAAARAVQQLPPACGPAGVTLVPDKRDIVLMPNESFQYLLQGEKGRVSADFVGTALPRDVLDLSMPLTQASTAIRLTAGSAQKQPMNTVVRISDSQGKQHFDITVKVCPKPAG